MSPPPLIGRLSGNAIVRPRVNRAFQLYSQRRPNGLVRLDPIRTQRKTLLRLIRRAARTRFGIDHRFESIRGVGDFQERVPLRTYEDLWNDYLSLYYPVLDDLTWPGRIPYL